MGTGNEVCVSWLIKRWTGVFSAWVCMFAIHMTATAQTAPNPPVAQPETPLQEITVTGTRIAAPNAVSTSPIQVISADSIATTGKTDLTDLLNQLPQVFNNGLGQDLGNGTSGLTTAGGVSTADLRGLGPNRTLVLVDGRRLGQGSPNTVIQSPAPDLDQIPAGLVDRIEVVTGGASAAYGSDAVAGVVNFIMKKNFQGIQVDGQLDANWHTNHDTFMQNLVANSGATPATGSNIDGRQKAFNVLMGTNFAGGEGNITAYLSYRHADPVASSQRDFGGCELDPIQDAHTNSVTGVACGGSSNSNWFEPLTGAHAGSVYNVYGTGFVPAGLGVVTNPPATYNSQPYIYMTREDDRYNAAVLAHETIDEALQPYAEFYFMDDKTHQQVAPSALFKDANPFDPFGSGNYPVNCDNPLLASSQASILCSPAQLAYVGANPGQGCIYQTNATTGAITSPNCADVRIGRRNVEGGGRASDFEHENYRAVLGTKGDFADAWTYDVYGQYYYTTFFNSNSNYLSFQGIDNALQVTGTRASPVCISGVSCVPYNIFSQGGVTHAQLQSLYELGTAQGTSTLRTLHAEITGDLGKYGIRSPAARDGLAVDVGFEHRTDSEYFQPDAAEESGNLAGFGAASAPIDESISVAEEFIELRAPLIQDQPGVHDLLFDTGYRRSDYSTSGETNTYKFEVQFAPIADYRLRLSYDKAIRAPSAIELYNPQIVGTTQLGNDPCAPTFNSNGTIAAPAAYSLAQCENLHVTPAQYGNGSTTNTIPQGTAEQLSQLAGGNPNLKPEQAETYTVGVNLAPSQIPNFTGSLDYYHIAIKDTVTTLPAGVIFSQCANNDNPLYCSQIVRNPVTGGLNTVGSAAQGGYVIQTNINAGALLVSGIDAQLNYRHDLPAGWGQSVLELNGTYVQHDKTIPVPGGGSYDCAGLFGFTCQTVTPRWRHIFRATWVTPLDVSLTATWRFMGSVDQDNNTSNPLLHYATFGGYDFVNPRIPSFSYLDLAATWHFRENLTVRAGINNVLDKDPPLLDSAIVPGGNANTNDVYDMFGRQLFLSFSAKY